MRRSAILLVVIAACGDDGTVSPNIDAAPAVDAGIDARTVFPDAPAGCAGELAFTQATGCANDGSVEFCIPANNAALITQLETISPSITCAAGGGRAMCNASPNLLLCFYPTAFPDQCTTAHGAMTDAVFTDMCQIAALPEVTMIVHTILE